MSNLPPSLPTGRIELTDLELKLDYQFKDSALLDRATTHKSFAYEQNQRRDTNFNNERLEFLGDAVLELALTALLMKRYANDAEGPLSKKRASLVNEDSLCKLALQIELDRSMLLGRGEVKSGGPQKPRLLASTLEAVLGAVFLDSGYDEAARVTERLFSSALDEMRTLGVDYGADYKTRLQELMQETRRVTPSYAVDEESGPDHDKIFVVTVRVENEVLATGTGKSKKAAEQDAARVALTAATAADNTGQAGVES